LNNNTNIKYHTIKRLYL